MGGGWWSRRHEIGKPSLFPPPLHTVPTASTCMAVCSPPNAPPSGAPKRAQGIWIAQWCCFWDGGGTSVTPNDDVSVDRRRHIARRVSRRFLAWACSRESETDELGARQGSGGTFVWEESMRFGS